ncbi:MAG TPA: hypothetical protein DCY94_03905 [Firmicutes bacterium]|nr:hypothetical protein [Bacillota bacterium]
MANLGDNLHKMEMFFDYDTKIKQLLMDIAPERYVLDEEHQREYEDKLFKTLEEIKYYMYCLVSKFKGEHSCREFEKFFKTVTDAITNATGNPFLLERAYKKYIYDIREEFVHSTHDSYSGYSPFSGWNVMEPLSINEYLHDLHMFITNGEYSYRNVPEIKSINIDRGTVILRGVENEKVLNIANAIAKANLNSIRTEILSLNDRILIMARDLGHATTVEIKFERGMAIVNYFIPKVTNYEMASALPGVNPLDKNKHYATGIFEVPEENISEALGNFLSKVPTDSDWNLTANQNYDNPENTKRIN